MSSAAPEPVKPVLFISDLHLCPTRPAINRIFFDFLDGPARMADSLYILGDLFEYWAGDDDVQDPFNRSIVSALGSCAATTPIRFMHGNRDFLLGDAFARDAGIQLIADPTIVDLFGVSTMLMHGDTLCTDDVEYMKFRAEVRSDGWKSAFLAKPLRERKERIEQLRARSEAEKQRKPPEVMDVNEAVVTDAFRRHGCSRLVHGHTHRAGLDQYLVDGERRERWVLQDWYTDGGVLICTPQGCRAEKLG